MKQKAYISGPMTGYKQYNFPAFHIAANQLRELGYQVYSPAEMDVIFEPDISVINAKLHSIEENRRYVRRDLHILCNEMKAENKDLVVTLLGWKKSVGASAEVAVARWLGLDIIEGHSILGAEVTIGAPNDESKESKEEQWKDQPDGYYETRWSPGYRRWEIG